jgi:hypothetical protein
MPPDNPIPVSAGIEFPRVAAISGTDIVQSNATDFRIATAGIYLVTFQVSVTEPGQLGIVGFPSATQQQSSIVGRAAGTSQIFGTFILTLAAGDLITIINDSETALTLTPYAGGGNPVAAHLTILRLK